MAEGLPIVLPGKRAAIAGRTGAGKSTLANWLAWHSPGKFVILNPKFTRAYNELPNCVRVDGLDFERVVDLIEDDEVRFINVCPDGEDSSAESMDEFVGDLHKAYSNIGLLADELYTLHIRGQAGPGLVGWLTRGRELGQSFIGLTQRPAWVSRFIFSESDYICAMDLALKDDRKRMYEMSGKDEMEVRLPPRYWHWYDVAADELTTYAPIPVNRG